MAKSKQRFPKWLRYSGFGLLGLGLLIPFTGTLKANGRPGNLPFTPATPLAPTALPQQLKLDRQEASMKVTVQKFYDALSNGGSVSLDQLNRFMAADWQSTPSPADGSSSKQFLKSVQSFNRLIPDLSWEPQEMLVVGNRVVVRSIASGTPKGNFFGVETDGTKSFRIMTIDIHTVEQGKLTTAFHVEDWHRAIRQLSSK